MIGEANIATTTSRQISASGTAITDFMQFFSRIGEAGIQDSNLGSRAATEWAIFSL
jgi:hypothetical protein